MIANTIVKHNLDFTLIYRNFIKKKFENTAEFEVFVNSKYLITEVYRFIRTLLFKKIFYLSLLLLSLVELWETR